MALGESMTHHSRRYARRESKIPAGETNNPNAGIVLEHAASLASQILAARGPDATMRLVLIMQHVALHTRDEWARAYICKRLDDLRQP